MRTCLITSRNDASGSRRQYCIAIGGAFRVDHAACSLVPGVAIISTMFVYVTTAISSM